jgi:hypothetical protein
VNALIQHEYEVSVARGRSRVQQTIACLIAAELIATAYDSPDPIRALLTLLLCWTLWRGYMWTRWVVMGLAVVGVPLAAGLFVLSLLQPWSYRSACYALLCVTGVAMLWCVRDPNVRTFMSRQRGHRTDSVSTAA